MSHTCQSVVVHCIDFRFQKAINNYLQKQSLLGDCDIVSIAGGARDLAHPSLVGTLSGNDQTAFVLAQVNTSKRLHDIKQIILINHSDCGAYGGSEAFDSERAEAAKHAADLKRAKELLEGAIPGIIVKGLLAKMDAAGQITFEPVI